MYKFALLIRSSSAPVCHGCPNLPTLTDRYQRWEWRSSRVFCLSSVFLLWLTAVRVLLVFQRLEVTHCKVVSVGKTTVIKPCTTCKLQFKFLTHSGDVFVATVTGATCNCLPSQGEESVIYCYDYQLESGEVSVELVDRGRCYGEAQSHYAVSIGAVHTCSSLAETREDGLVNGMICILIHELKLIIVLLSDSFETGYTVQGPGNTTLLPLRNLTDTSGRCDFPCVLNVTSNYPGQACFYDVTITEVIKGSYTVSTLSLSACNYIPSSNSLSCGYNLKLCGRRNMR